jgi:hypothetical protein
VRGIGYFSIGGVGEGGGAENWAVVGQQQEIAVFVVGPRDLGCAIKPPFPTD